MSLPPREIPLGAMRFNSDSQKLEYWNGDIWMQVHTFNPDLNGGVRGVYNIGDFPAQTNTLEFLTVSSQGNATNFGDMTSARMGGCVPSSRTRGLFAGGNTGAPAYSSPNTIDYITFSSTGNAQDFGDLNENLGGGPPGASSPTRGLFCGGYHPSPSLTCRNTIQFVTIATTGNAKDFGDMTTVRAHGGVSGNSTRILISSGYSDPNTKLDSIDKVTIASLGNATNFGDASHVAFAKGSTSSSTRSVFIGGSGPSSTVTTIEYNEIATEGDSVDFGDMSATGAWIGATGNGHGGLG